MYIETEFLKDDFLDKTSQETRKETLMGKRIVELMRLNPHITIKELTKEIGASVSGIKYTINSLKKSGRIAREGSTKAGT